MLEIKKKHNCSGCSACFNICPKGCIKMEEDSEGFCYPKIDKTNCINCGLCEKVCPIINKQKIEPTQKLRAFACINKNEEIRLKSSSGGAFSAFAEYVIENGGVVFGAGFNSCFNVCHQFCETKEDLEKLRASKYVQSKIGETFKQAKEFLNQGRLVYFSGTACQIGGLKSYLRKDYPNLITQDLICHGVPSPLVWEKYVNLKTNEGKLKLSKITFRDKSTGWQQYSFTMKFEDENCGEYKKSHFNEPYMNMFLYNKILRPSCHKCSFKGNNRIADITLADFWGGVYKKYAPHFNDKKGVSLVLIHSLKGQAIFNNLTEKLNSVEVNPKTALKANPMVKKSTIKSPSRYFAMKALNKLPFEKFVKRYGKVLL